jgi:hypothetical protein
MVFPTLQAGALLAELRSFLAISMVMAWLMLLALVCGAGAPSQQLSVMAVVHTE